MVLKFGKGRGFGHSNRLSQGSGGGALSAPTLTRTSGVTAYPPTFTVTLPVTAQNGDILVFQRSQDVTFATGVTETTTALTGGTGSYNLSASSVVSGVWYFRAALYHGARPALNWSNTSGVGTATAPTMTSSATQSGYQYIGQTIALTASLPSTFAITGGVDQAQARISGANLIVDAQTTAGALDIRVTPTSVFQVLGTEQTITDTIAANTPSTFTFTDISSASLSTLYTSNTITVAGLTGGASVPVTITGGTYSKNGGAYTSAAGTAINGDTFAVQVTSGSANNMTANVALTIGATSDTYTVATPVVLSTTTAWSATDHGTHFTRSGADNLTAQTVTGIAGFEAIRADTYKSSGFRLFEYKSLALNGDTNIQLGLGNASASVSNYVGGDAHAISWTGGQFNTNNAFAASAPRSVTDGDTVGFLVDFTAKRLYVHLNGTWINSADPVAKTGGIDISGITGSLTPMSGCGSHPRQWVLNTGHSAMSITLPSGVTVWDL